MIAIIGATGKIGSKVTEKLLSNGYKTRVIARSADKLKPYGERGAEIAAGDIADREFLSRALTGCDTVLTMIPADFQAADIGAFQDKLGESIISAIKQSGVKNVVNISSVGGHTEKNTGIVAGLARQEVRLNALENVNVLNLRPTYFMENLFMSVELIRSQSIFGSALEPDTALPMIATQDIAEVAYTKLTSPDFNGKTVLPLLGPKDYTMPEVTSALGKAIGKPDLPYMRFASPDVKSSFMQFGISESVADSYVELSEGINKGVFGIEERNERTTTPTTIEQFAQEFGEVYKG